MDVPEDRARTVAMLKGWGLWPLDARHKDSGPCACASCFEGSPALVELAPKRKRVALPWEDDFEEAA